MKLVAAGLGWCEVEKDWASVDYLSVTRRNPCTTTGSLSRSCQSGSRASAPTRSATPAQNASWLRRHSAASAKPSPSSSATSSSIRSSGMILTREPLTEARERLTRQILDRQRRRGRLLALQYCREQPVTQTAITRVPERQRRGHPPTMPVPRPGKSSPGTCAARRKTQMSSPVTERRCRIPGRAPSSATAREPVRSPHVSTAARR